MPTRPSTSTWADDLSDEADESDNTRLLGNRVASYQATHEEGLNKLGEAIKRQKYVATELATEVELHNEILEDIDTGLTSTNENLRKNTRNINLVSKGASTFYLWFIIVALAIVIVSLAIL